MLLRHKVTGNVYSYHKVLVDSGEYEIYEEPKPVVVPEQPAQKKTRRPKTSPNNGVTHGADAE